MASKRKLPTATVEAEKSVIGSILIAGSDGDIRALARVFATLTASDFQDGGLGRVFGAMHELYLSGGVVDVVTTAARLRLKGEYEQVGGATTLAECGQLTPTSAHLPHYAGIVVELSRKRELDSLFSDASAAARNGQSSGEVLSNTLSSLEDFQRRGAGKQTERFTFGQLAVKFPRLDSPVIDGLLREGETVNIVSHTKIGKSWFAYSLDLSILTGRDWFGFPTAMGKVLHIDNELKQPTLVHRFSTVADAMGIPHSHLANDLEIWPLRGRLRSLETLADDLYRITPGEFKLIVFDAKYRFAAAGTSENDNHSEAQFYNLVDNIAERTGAAIALIHHKGKGDQSGKRLTDVGAGAGSQARAADAHLVLREHEDSDAVVLDAAVRSFPPIEPLVLRWNFPVWSADHNGDPKRLKMAVTGNERLQEKRDREGKLTIVSALLTGPATARSLRTRTGMSPERVTRLLADLDREGQITSQEITVMGNQCLEYSNVESTL